MTEQGVVNDKVPERYFILAQRRKGAKKTPERGNRRTDEQGLEQICEANNNRREWFISNVEVPEQYFFNHESTRINTNPERYIFNH